MASVSFQPDLGAELVTAAQRGDRPAADQLIRDHDGWVRSVIYSVTGRADLVDDIAQQVWTQAWERLASLNDPQRLRAWLYTIARHVAIDMGQARKRKAVGQYDGLEEVVHDRRQQAPARVASDGELREVLLRAVESLPALYREPFVLRHVHDWSYAQIGELLNMPVETVETRLVRARRLLRETLAGKVLS